MANELNADMLKVALESIDEFAARELPDALLIELDERDEFPEEIVRAHVRRRARHPAALHPRASTAGMGGGAFDVYRVCERMARDRPRHRDRRARDVPRQRPDPRRRHGRAEARAG